MFANCIYFKTVRLQSDSKLSTLSVKKLTQYRKVEDNLTWHLGQRLLVKACIVHDWSGSELDRNEMRLAKTYTKRCLFCGQNERLTNS